MWSDFTRWPRLDHEVTHGTSFLQIRCGLHQSSLYSIRTVTYRTVRYYVYKLYDQNVVFHIPKSCLKLHFRINAIFSLDHFWWWVFKSSSLRKSMWLYLVYVACMILMKRYLRANLSQNYSVRYNIRFNWKYRTADIGRSKNGRATKSWINHEGRRNCRINPKRCNPRIWWKWSYKNKRKVGNCTYF